MAVFQASVLRFNFFAFFLKTFSEYLRLYTFIGEYTQRSLMFVCVCLYACVISVHH